MDIIYYIFIVGDSMKVFTNNKGFTLVEIIAVIALLGLVIGICVPSVMNASENVKKKNLKNKVESIENAAVLYGQDHRENFGTECSDDEKTCDGKSSDLCICYDKIITVGDLLSSEKVRDEYGEEVEIGPYLNYDDGTSDITNSVSGESLMNCEIQIYKKYNKIYAVYLDRDTQDEICWYK